MTIALLHSFQEHVRAWEDCTRCELHQTRKKVCLARGVLPCDLLFIGEGPGKSEDVLGRPFVGPAGQLLDRIVAAALPEGCTTAFSNLVACIPWDPEEQHKKAGEPPEEAIRACAPRLEEFARLAAQRLLVGVGKQAQELLTPGYRRSLQIDRTIPRIEITHPAAILRAPTIQQGIMAQRCIVILRNAVEEYLA